MYINRSVPVVRHILTSRNSIGYIDQRNDISRENLSNAQFASGFGRYGTFFEQIRRHRIWGRSSVSSGYRTTCNAESFHSKGMCGMEKFAAAKYYDFLEIENPDFVLRGTSSQCRCSKQYDIPDAHEYGTILECIISENYFRTHW